MACKGSLSDPLFTARTFFLASRSGKERSPWCHWKFWHMATSLPSLFFLCPDMSRARSPGVSNWSWSLGVANCSRCGSQPTAAQRTLSFLWWFLERRFPGRHEGSGPLMDPEFACHNKNKHSQAPHQGTRCSNLLEGRPFGIQFNSATLLLILFSQFWSTSQAEGLLCRGL